MSKHPQCYDPLCVEHNAQGSEQPQEWTAEDSSVLMSLDDETYDRVYFHCTDERNAKAAVDAHNAALAASHMQGWDAAIRTCAQQLAAEERRANDSIEENVRLLNVLAEERSKVKMLVEALEKLRENCKRGQAKIIDDALAKVKDHRGAG